MLYLLYLLLCEQYCFKSSSIFALVFSIFVFGSLYLCMYLAFWYPCMYCHVELNCKSYFRRDSPLILATGVFMLTRSVVNINVNVLHIRKCKQWSTHYTLSKGHAATASRRNMISCMGPNVKRHNEKREKLLIVCTFIKACAFVIVGNVGIVYGCREYMIVSWRV